MLLIKKIYKTVKSVRQCAAGDKQNEIKILKKTTTIRLKKYQSNCVSN